MLRRLGVDVSFPEDQTCCGQIAFNGGFRSHAADVAKHFLDVFENEEQVVVPSGSCASMIKVYYRELFEDDPETLERAQAVGERTRELSDYIVNVVGTSDVGAAAEGLATSCASCASRKRRATSSVAFTASSCRRWRSRTPAVGSEASSP